jgi:hypothetical protein
MRIVQDWEPARVKDAADLTGVDQIRWEAIGGVNRLSGAVNISPMADRVDDDRLLVSKDLV